MLKKLQEKWGLNGSRFILVLCTFAVTGTFTAWVSREITNWFDAAQYSFTWWALKIFVLLIGYQVFILAFGFCFGQFAFFWKFEKKLLNRLGILKRPNDLIKRRIAIFASGAGSNASRIIDSFKNNESIDISLIVCNKPKAGVIHIAEKNNIPVLHISRKDMEDGVELTSELKNRGIYFIVLAGFLLRLPSFLINSYPKKILNIHPALLPKYGGHGMYGKYVHQAVIQNKELQSGITIHYVDEVYDNGEIVFQATCEVLPNDDDIQLSNKIHELEHRHYPEVIRSIIEKQNRG